MKATAPSKKNPQNVAENKQTHKMTFAIAQNRDQANAPHPAHRRMCPVLHLDPMLQPANLIGPAARRFLDGRGVQSLSDPDFAAKSFWFVATSVAFLRLVLQLTEATLRVG
jgi:hypothetical protein